MRSRNWVFLCAACFAVSTFEAPCQVDTEPGPAIHLRSRSFTPVAQTFEIGSDSRSIGEKVHVLLQLCGKPDSSTRSALRQSGIVLLDYVPDDAWFASVPKNLVVDDAARQRILWMGEILPEDKLSPSLLRPRDATPDTSGADEDLVVRYFRDADPSVVQQQIEILGGIITDNTRELRRLAVRFDGARILELAAIDDIRWIELLPPPSRGESDRIRTHVGATESQVAGMTGAGVTVGVFENHHADVNHADFGGPARIARGDSDPLDADDHTTSVAGVIGGDGSHCLSPPNHGGAGNWDDDNWCYVGFCMYPWSKDHCDTANQWRGLAPATRLYTYDYATGNGAGTSSANEANFLGDLQTAVGTHHIDVANNSWGNFGCTAAGREFDYGEYRALCADLDDIVRGEFGRAVSVVFSAGNERDGFSDGSTEDTTCITQKTLPYANYGTINDPKAAKNIIVVGAVDSMDNRMTTYSSWGPVRDGRLKPDLVASGQHDGTVSSSGVRLLDNPWGCQNGQRCGSDIQQAYRAPATWNWPYYYNWFSATSSAAATVSGAMALVLESYRSHFGMFGDPLPSTLKALLIHGAQDLDDSTTWYNAGPDYASGYGLLQVNTSIHLAEDSVVEGQVEQGESAAYVLSTSAPVKITLAWDDAPGVENAATALVNDLDLVVRDPNGVRHYPWTLDPANPSAAASRSREDHTNNVEQVYVDEPVGYGQWTIEVVGGSVPTGPQRYSLVASGIASSTRSLRKGLVWLANVQNADGSWTYNREHPDAPFAVEDVWITSMATLAFLNLGVEESYPPVRKAIDWLRLQQRADGAITTEGGNDGTNTGLAVTALTATGNPQYYGTIVSAVNYLVDTQNVADPAHPDYGGWNNYGESYGSGPYNGIPNVWASATLNSTDHALQALHYGEAFEPSDTIVPSVVWDRAGVFVRRCQNLSATNPENMPGFDNDGGYLYMPTGRGVSLEGHSTGSMTGAGLWFLRATGLTDRSDPRVSAAWNWFAAHWVGRPTVHDLGWYYYDYGMARACAAWDIGALDTPIGHVDCHASVSSYVECDQAPDGHWDGTAPHAWETDIAATSLAVLALEMAELPAGSSLSITGGSPIRLEVIDPRGNLYVATGPTEEPKKVFIANAIGGDYAIRVVGLDAGDYTLTISGKVRGVARTITQYHGRTEAGRIDDSKLTVSSLAGPVTLDYVPRINTAPHAVAGPDQTLECTGSLEAIAHLDGSASSDPDSMTGTNDDIVSFDWTETGTPLTTGEWASVPLHLGTHDVTLTVSDRAGATGTDDTVITVLDTTPPTITCPASVTVECRGINSADVALPPATGTDFCYGSATVTNDRSPAGADASGTYPLGATVITFTATDGSGNSATCRSTVTVVDTTPPLVTVDASPNYLWPPNHKMYDVHNNVTVFEACDPSPSLVLEAASSSEPDDTPGGGDGNTVDDIQGATIGSADFDLRLRAERMGQGSGRIYSLRYTATDDSGNVGTVTDTVSVPHDQAGIEEPLALSVADSSATMVSWEPVYWARHFDVIRGDLAQLRADESNVDLGRVVCLGTNMTTNDTTGSEDPGVPEPGQVLFYLVQFSDGTNESGYGEHSAQKARVVGADGQACH